MDVNILVLIGVITFLIAAVIGSSVYVIARWFSCSQHDYVTWFVLHFGIGIIAILVVAALAIAGKLDSGATAVLTSIVAYTLGATANKSSQSCKDQAVPTVKDSTPQE